MRKICYNNEQGESRSLPAWFSSRASESIPLQLYLSLQCVPLYLGLVNLDLGMIQLESFRIPLQLELAMCPFVSWFNDLNLQLNCCTIQLVRFEKVTTRGLECIGNVEFTCCCCCCCHCCGGLGVSGNQFNPWICRLFLADEQIIQTVTSVQQLANMETELEQALERVRRHKVHHFQLLKSYNIVHLRTKSSKKTLSIALCHIRSWNLKFCFLGTSTDLWKCLSTINILEFINNFV
jgi:hypothetical protein